MKAEGNNIETENKQQGRRRITDDQRDYEIVYHWKERTEEYVLVYGVNDVMQMSQLPVEARKPDACCKYIVIYIFLQ